MLSDAVDGSAGTAYSVTSSIQDDLIPNNAIVVFDWDNTLKVINTASRKIESRVTPEFLGYLREVKHCDLYIISAIRPSKINLETLLLEVDRLNLREFFIPRPTKPSYSAKNVVYEGSEDMALDVTMEVQEGRYASWGNIIICGYDKAEVFLEFLAKKKERENDEIDSAQDSIEYECEGEVPEENVTEKSKDREVVFFDDELPNITNFSTLVSKSRCYLVQ